MSSGTGRRYFAALSGVAAAVVVVVLIVAGLPRKAAKPAEQSAAAPTIEDLTARPPATQESEPKPAPVAATRDATADQKALIREDFRPETPIEKRLELGLPVSPNPRRTVYLATTQQAVPQVARDLGNIFADSYTASPEHMGSLKTLASWADSLESNLKVLRVIEAGRANPGEVGGVLREEISKALDAYDETRKAKEEYDRRWAAGEVPAPSITESDPYYAENGRYEDPSFELQRLHRVIVSSFYVLANINEKIDGQLLARWVKKQQSVAYSCPEADVWLIDCYFAQQQTANSVERTRHEELIGKTGVSRTQVAVSTWDAPWSLRDPMAAVARADLSDIKTIEVLAVPVQMKLAPSTRFRIIQNFIGQFARTTK